MLFDVAEELYQFAFSVMPSAVAETKYIEKHLKN